jgi:hypothetical protein
VVQPTEEVNERDRAHTPTRHCALDLYRNGGDGYISGDSSMEPQTDGLV